MLSRGPPLHRLTLIVSEAAQARPGVPSRPLAVAHTAAQRALHDQRGSATREVCEPALYVSAHNHLSRVGSSQLLDDSILPHNSMHVSKVIPVSGVSQGMGSVLSSIPVSGISQDLDLILIPVSGVSQGVDSVSDTIPVSGASQDVGSVLVDFHSSVLPTCDVSLRAAGEDVIDNLISKLPSSGVAQASVVVDTDTVTVPISFSSVSDRECGGSRSSKPCEALHHLFLLSHAVALSAIVETSLLKASAPSFEPWTGSEEDELMFHPHEFRHWSIQVGGFWTWMHLHLSLIANCRTMHLIILQLIVHLRAVVFGLFRRSLLYVVVFLRY